MKQIYVHKQVIGWEQYTFEVEDNFEDYQSLVDDMNWTDWEYLADASENTGTYEIYNEDYELIS